MRGSKRAGNPETVSVMRVLRLKYGISLNKLASSVGVSTQYMSGLELGRDHAGERAMKLVCLAFERVTEDEIRHALLLLADYTRNKHRLFEFVPNESEGVP